MIRNHNHLFKTLFLINFLISLGFGVSDAFFPLYCQSIGARGLLLGVAVGGCGVIGSSGETGCGVPRSLTKGVGVGGLALRTSSPRR